MSYVTGGGGAKPEPISHCQPYDAYGIGWSSTGGSKCGSATKPTVVDQVFHYLLVNVNGQQVTVTPINSLGQSVRPADYDFSPDNIAADRAVSNLQASAPVGNRVDLQWDASIDANGIEAYDIYRAAPGRLGRREHAEYSDTTVGPNTPYSYVVKARDPSNNTSDPSNTATITTPRSTT